MRDLLKALITFSRREKRGILVLVTTILLVSLCGSFLAIQKKKRLGNEKAELAQATALEEYRKFLATVQEREKQREQEWKNRTNRSYSPRSALTPIPFNPNQADSVTLQQLGLPTWMVSNILRYREKGGRFRRVEDFKKIYGLSEEQYKQLQPYIHIAPEDTIRPRTNLFLTDIQSDSLTPKVEKYPAGTIVDLNVADTTELKKIPGIGSGIARMIVSYRQRLGGFYQLEQLKEINLDYKQLREWLVVRPEAIQRINLNRCSIKQLYRHPYFNFYQAKAIVELRKKQGDFKNLKSLTLLEEFTAEEIERIRHYVCFE
ncbi:MAG: helix-hairpin-helix domain-containing protein [Bacteroides sp.]|nr:helix-hairpin-helix domain-containing protein [Bacteroides sp.]MBO5014805.1 helix-hairpin-helix domain-containing protein [Bacteroidaceae bacterium]